MLYAQPAPVSCQYDQYSDVVGDAEPTPSILVTNPVKGPLPVPITATELNTSKPVTPECQGAHTVLSPAMTSATCDGDACAEVAPTIAVAAPISTVASRTGSPVRREVTELAAGRPEPSPIRRR